ncbi:MAG: ATPase, T2SS/T4P/T4SS family [Candidatus Saccharibacteria bacterium]|nr:ATPase, T2SS/T4P/T4SS family [Candidatus Saccharibacteria bacterium]
MDEREIQQKRRENEEKATKERARILGLPYLDTREFENRVPLVKGMLSVKEMRANHILPLYKGGGEEHFQFMVTSQTPRSLILKMEQEYNDDGEKVDFFLVSNSAYKVFMLRYDPPVEIQYDDIKIAGEGDSETLAEVSKTLNSVSSDKVFDFLIDQAERLGASDIHIENMRDKIRVRMRVDGLLHPVAEIDRDKYRILIGELSSRANISTALNRPQSGHMQKEVITDGGKRLLNIRVEVIPTMYGQDAVMRLFNFDEGLLNLDLLGLSEDERKKIDMVISHPRGLVLIVGPTGSGKSTTLYSMLNALNTPERKIITLEEPIEYGITGISQIPIDTENGGSFAEGLRSVLRLDPDVVMVGEIRDADTAKTAIQASITGHLVLSSFHANSTSAAFTRMIDLVGENPIFVSSIRLIMAQRLVRRLAKTKKERRATPAEVEYIQGVLTGVSMSNLEGIDLDEIKLYDAVPNEEFPFGYDGRIVIMEQMIVSEEIQALIRGGVAEINTEKIERAAKAEKMLTLEQKGVIMALRGETTLDEVSRVI